MLNTYYRVREILIVYQALIQSKLDVRLNASECFTATKAILFFGTPHLGTKWSDVHATFLRISKIFKPTTEHIAEQLSNHSQYLIKLQSQFARFRETLKIVYLYEEYATSTPLGATLVISFQSTSMHIINVNRLYLEGPPSQTINGMPSSYAKTTSAWSSLLPRQTTITAR